MTNREVEKSSILTGLDLQIVRSLQLNPRVSFALMGSVLGVAEQTVARRYRRMVRDGVLRVVGAVDPGALGLTDWIVRLRCRPDGADALAAALGRREDVSWLHVSAGGSELQFSLRSRSDAAREDLLLRLPRSAPVLDVAPLMVLRRFLGGRDGGWTATDSLTTDQIERLTAVPGGRSPSGGEPRARDPRGPAALDPADHRLLDALSLDGRSSVAALTAVSGLSAGRVARRLAALEAAEILYFDVDVSLDAIGAHSRATVWAVVEPRRLEQAGRELATHPEVPFCVALTGPHNLSLAVMAATHQELYEYVSTRFAQVEGVLTAEVSPTLRQVKQAGAIVTSGRLAASV